jgi:hypothetical protein
MTPSVELVPAYTPHKSGDPPPSRFLALTVMLLSLGVVVAVWASREARRSWRAPAGHAVAAIEIGFVQPDVAVAAEEGSSSVPRRPSGKRCPELGDVPVWG